MKLNYTKAEYYNITVQGQIAGAAGLRYDLCICLL